MNELINATEKFRSVRWNLLVTASAIALVSSAYGIVDAIASDDTRPTVWIELGGQLERIDGLADPFLPPFALLSPTPQPYRQTSPAEAQKPSIYGYGAEGNITYQPNGSDWSFSAGLRYGRSSNSKHVHQQSNAQTHVPNLLHQLDPVGHPSKSKYVSFPQFLDSRVKNSESHVVVDFQVGRDVGLGMFSRRMASTVHLGVRFAEFTEKSNEHLIARPEVDFRGYQAIPGKYAAYFANHNDFVASADNSHSFEGVGPSLSWSGIAPLLGNLDTGEVAFDWSVNGAVLFGRQKAEGSSHTMARNYPERYQVQATPPYGAIPLYNTSASHNRTRSVVVPNLGGLVGVSFNYAAAKVRFGYRADFFFGAMDAGVGSRHTIDRNFYGPFATISIGLGG